METATQTKEQDHAYQNACGWAETIAELVAALECDYDRLEELRDERETLNEARKQAHAEYIEGGEEEGLPTLMSAEEAANDALRDWDAEYGDELQELTIAATIDGERCTDGENARERIQEGPLSVEVRSGWYEPGSDSEARQPDDFRILLSTGGPALQIRGELNDHMEPRRAWLEYQDWGTPWTEYHGEGCTQEHLLTYCQQFFFGE